MATDSIRSFEDLDCWKACRVLRIFVARSLCKVLPKEERYRLGDQLLRAARSTTANIAEGYGRFHYLDNAKFCSNARGSASEVLDHVITAEDEQLAPEEITTEARAHVQKAVALLNGYIAYLRRAASTKPALEGGSSPITSNE
jgi:four helix bundle protein